MAGTLAVIQDDALVFNQPEYDGTNIDFIVKCITFAGEVTKLFKIKQKAPLNTYDV